jgi:hypothetical protein
MGYVPPYAKVGDEVAILSELPMPFVIRRKDDHYLLLGECFVLCIMNGEALENLDGARVGVLQFQRRA